MPQLGRAFRRHLCREHGFGCDNLCEGVSCKTPANGRFRAANQDERKKHSNVPPLVEDVFGPLPRPFRRRPRDRFSERRQISDTMGAEIDDGESLGWPTPTIRPILLLLTGDPDESLNPSTDPACLLVQSLPTLGEQLRKPEVVLRPKIRGEWSYPHVQPRLTVDPRYILPVGTDPLTYESESNMPDGSMINVEMKKQELEYPDVWPIGRGAKPKMYPRPKFDA